jgi:hypothetical protein
MKRCKGDMLTVVQARRTHEIPDGEPWMYLKNADGWEATFCMEHYIHYVGMLVVNWGRNVK